jgi:hypothetical protein
LVSRCWLAWLIIVMFWTVVEIFAAVSTPTQCQMLLSVAQKISNTLEQCRLLLLAMRKFPNLVFEHGVGILCIVLHVYCTCTLICASLGECRLGAILN